MEGIWFRIGVVGMVWVDDRSRKEEEEGKARILALKSSCKDMSNPWTENLTRQEDFSRGS